MEEFIAIVCSLGLLAFLIFAFRQGEKVKPSGNRHDTGQNSAD